MNFESKSTLDITQKTIRHWWKYLRRQHHTKWIVAINFSTTLMIGWLYFSNVILPATIGSQPYGNTYIELIKLIIIIKLVSTIYAAGFMGWQIFLKQHGDPEPGRILQLSTIKITHTVQRYGYAMKIALQERLAIPILKRKKTSID